MKITKNITAIMLIIIIFISNINILYALIYEYDALGRLTNVNYNEKKKVDYSYDAGGNIKKVNGFNGDTESTTELLIETTTEIITEKPTENPAETITERVTEKPTENPAETTTERVTEKPTEKPVETTTEIITEKTTEKPVETTTEIITEASTQVTTEGVRASDYSWNFTSDKFSGLSSINSNMTVDYLTFNANSDKDMARESKSKELNGIKYGYALNLKGVGNRYYRSLKFYAKHNSDIYVAVKSSSSDTRELAIDNSKGRITAIPAKGDLEVYKIKYTGNDDYIYIYSLSNAILVYEIGIRQFNNDTTVVNKNWNVTESKFDGALSNKEIDGLRFAANTELYKSDESLYGKVYKRHIDLTGKGSNDEKAVSFEIGKNSDIYIKAKSSGASGRVLLVVNEFGYVIDKIIVNATLKTYRVSYGGNGDRIYLRSSDSGIRIYEIDITERDLESSEKNKTWRFSDETFNNYANVSGIYDELEISSNIILNQELIKANDTTYYKSLKINSGGNFNSGHIAFTAPKDTPIKITAISADGNQRALVAVNKYGFELGSLTTTSSVGELNIKSISSKDKIYLFTKYGSILITKIQLGQGSGFDDGDSFNRIHAWDNITDNISANRNNNLTGNYKDQLNTCELEIYNEFVRKFTGENQSVAASTKIEYPNDSVEYNEQNANTLKEYVKNAYSAFINDNPEVFWLEDLSVGFAKVDDEIDRTYIFINRNKNIKTDSDLKNQINSLNGCVDSVLNQFENSKSKFRFANVNADEFDKIKFLYESISDNTNYNKNSSNSNNAYGVFQTEDVTSEGVARGFKLLCKKINIPCYIARGKSQIENGQNSYWNYVKIDGKWYICDLAKDVINGGGSELGILKAETNEYSKICSNIFVENGKFSLPKAENVNYFVWGDANLDNVVDNSDADFIIAQTLAPGGTLFTESRNYINSDVDYSGNISSSDAALVIKKLLNTEMTAEILEKGIVVTSSELEAFDEDNNGVFDVDDLVIGVNRALNNEASNVVSTQSVRRARSKLISNISREEILELFQVSVKK